LPRCRNDAPEAGPCHDVRRVALSFDAACDLFLAHLKVERNLSPNTLDGYGRDLARLGRFLEGRRVKSAAAVTPAHITDYLLTLADAELSARSRARALVAIRGLFRYLAGERHVDGDPTETIDAPRIGRRLPDVLGMDAVDRLLAAPHPDSPRGLRDCAMLETLYATGLRVQQAGRPGHGGSESHLRLGPGHRQGRKQRMVPLGEAAASGWPPTWPKPARASCATRPSVACSSPSAARHDTPGLLEAPAPLLPRRRNPARVAPPAAPLVRHPPHRGAVPICARCKRCSATPT
jgi:site-specific recombinase XerD